VVPAMAVIDEVDRGALVIGSRHGMVARRGRDEVRRGRGKVAACAGTGARWGKGAVWRQMRGDAPTARCECNGEQHTC